MREYFCEVPLLGKKEKHQLHYIEWGDAEAAKVMFCVHGLTRNARDFDFLAQRFVEEGYRVVCPDMAGRGKSAWLASPKLYGYPLYVQDVLALMELLGLERVDFVGTSMGGLVGMMIAHYYPQKLGKLVMNDIGPFLPADALNQIGEMVGQEMSFDDFAEVTAFFEKYLLSFGVNDKEHFDHIVQYGCEKKADGRFYLKYDPQIAQPFRKRSGKQKKLPAMDLWKMWKNVNVPLLVLRGEISEVLPLEVAQRMAEKENVTLLEFSGVGHAPMLMEKMQMDAVVQWMVADEEV